MGIFMLILLIALNLYLRSYTNHGQKLTLPDFNDMHLRDASILATEKTFQIIVNDSTHIVGMPGGVIINQNPKAGSQVKENRKIYVTATKYQSDLIRMKSLPELYGREYELKRKELSHLKINTRVKDYKYDPGEPDHVLEVYYKDKLIVSGEDRDNDLKIEKGGTLDFVLSKRSGLSIQIPDLRCQTLAAAQFLLEDGARLRVGVVREEGEIDDVSSAYIIQQYPPYEEDATMQIGNAIDLIVTAEKPEDCQ